MKLYLPTLVLALFISSSSFAQSSQKFSYLVVNINEKQDRENNNYYVIEAEENNPNAAAIYALTPHTNKAGKKKGCTCRHRHLQLF